MPRRALIVSALIPLAVVCTPALAEPPTHPMKVPSASAADGSVFQDPKAVSHTGKAGNLTKWFEMLGTADGKYSAGTYSSTAVRFTTESYPDNEFMLFIKGGVTLTSADGTVLEVHAGDGVVIPKGWKGVWDTPGYTKFYVTYDPAASPRK